MAEADLPFLVAGGGIGGLCAAIALSRKGFPVHVLEAAPDFMEVGAGLQIGPNAGRILANWGLGDKLRQHARRPQRLLLRDGITGRVLATVPLGDTAEARYGAPYLAMTRYRLHQLLLEAAVLAGNITLSRGFRVTGWSTAGERVTVQGMGRETLAGRALVAADGVHSALRETISPGARAKPSGRTAFRAIAQPSQRRADDDAICVWMVPDAHLVHYRTGSDEGLNMVAILRDETIPPDDGAPLEAERLQDGFRDCCFDLRLLIASGESWTRWPLLTMPPVARWSKGPAALLGDAAHPVSPFLASGAVMAIEDAAVLAQEIGRTPRDARTALQRYGERRSPRIAQVAAAVERTGGIYHMNGVMRHLRNAALGLWPPGMLLSRQDWLYGFRP